MLTVHLMPHGTCTITMHNVGWDCPHPTQSHMHALLPYPYIHCILQEENRGLSSLVHTPRSCTVAQWHTCWPCTQWNNMAYTQEEHTQYHTNDMFCFLLMMVSLPPSGALGTLPSADSVQFINTFTQGTGTAHSTATQQLTSSRREVECALTNDVDGWATPSPSLLSISGTPAVPQKLSQQKS